MHEPIDDAQKRIDQIMAKHPDAALFQSLPGAGKALAPRLLTAFGSQRDRFETADDMVTCEMNSPHEIPGNVNSITGGFEMTVGPADHLHPEAMPARVATLCGVPSGCDGTLEVRPGFVSLRIPPLEHWSEPLAWLSCPQRERFEEPEFYQLLQREIIRRLPLLPRAPD